MNTKAQKAKVSRVMREFYAGELYSSSGARVTSADQAKAIAMSEAGLSRKGTTMKKKKSSHKPTAKKTTARRKAVSRQLETVDSSIARARKTLSAAERREAKLKSEIKKLDELATGSLKTQLSALGYTIKPAAKSAKNSTSFGGVKAQRDVVKRGKIVFTGTAHDVTLWLKKRHPDFAVKAAKRGGQKRAALARTKQSITGARARIERLSRRRGALLRQHNGG